MTATMDATLIDDWLRWRMERERELREPYGWLSLGGLHWLDLQPREYAGIPGAWRADRQGVYVTAAGHEGLCVDGRLVDGTHQLSLHEAGRAMFAECGRVRLELLRRVDRYALRLRDPDAPALAEFPGVATYDPNPEWRVPAEFELYARPTMEVVGTAQVGLWHRLQVVGRVRFTLRGHDYELAATAGRGSGLTVAFSDVTCGGLAVPWRTLAVPRPRAGRAVLDFNRSVYPPAAFSEYGTCPAPPAGNALPLAVTAGEKPPRVQAARARCQASPGGRTAMPWEGAGSPTRSRASCWGRSATRVGRPETKSGIRSRATPT